MGMGRVSILVLLFSLLVPIRGAAEELALVVSPPHRAPMPTRALDRGTPPPALALQANEIGSVPSLNLIPVLSSPEKEAAAAVRALRAPAQPEPSARILLRLGSTEPQPVPLSPLPANASSTAFPYSRVRGPFEQVYPRPW